MSDWPDTRFRELLRSRLPIIAAPMAGAAGVELAVAAIRGGGVGSLPCAMLTPDQVRAESEEVRQRAQGPLNLNFLCHAMPEPPDEGQWVESLAPYYGLENVMPAVESPPLRRPFDEAMCAVVEEVRPEIVSFHFGVPEERLVRRLFATGARILGNATTPEEAAILALRGCDAIIAQGFEAGGHAGYFMDGHQPVGLFALVRQIACNLPLPVIAAGGIVDGRGVAAAMLLGASAVQIGTAYLATPESRIAAPHREKLGTLSGEGTVFTNLFSGREARGLRNRLIYDEGPMRADVPPFPYASAALAPLRAAAEADGRGDYSPMWAGQAAALAHPIGAQELTETLGRDALALLTGSKE
ncbi:MAG TPA: nitronate monooxygenase [Allosphingosinicella sp.]|nr:nitronate monooxygenase [Allosphingosinicella sp.]